MKLCKNIFLALVVLCLFLSGVKAQVQTARYISMIPHTNAYYEYLPEGYPEAGKKYPLMIFFHGSGETGPGTATSLPAVLRNGPPKLINEGRFPKNFTVNNVNYKFIVISPQFNDWPTENDADNVINYLVAHYPVDINRIYLTGLSMGGGVVWNYSGNDINHATRLAAIVPVCGAGYPYQPHARTIASANLPVWATHNSIDNAVPPYYTIDYVNNINSAPVPPNPLAKKTIFTVPSNNHDAWTKTYDTAFRENGLNVYEWMLQYRRFFAVLPVTGLSFTATAAANNKVLLQWNTVTEINVARFRVQRSTDGIVYNDIATINSSGQNGAGAAYSYEDNYTYPGIVYYRLQADDADGNKTFSDIRTVDMRTDNRISIYPNPADKELIIAGPSFNNSVLQIINTGGQVVYTKRLNGNILYRINITSLTAGTYYAIIDDRGAKQRFSFIKK